MLGGVSRGGRCFRWFREFKFLSTHQPDHQPDTKILVDDTEIGNFGLTHDMTGQKISAPDNTDTF